MEAKTRIAELYERLDGKVIIAAELDDKDLDNLDLDTFSRQILVFFDGTLGVKILDRRMLEEIKSKTTDEEPVEVNVSSPVSFKPLSKEYEPQVRIKNVTVDKTGGGVADFAAHFSDRYRRLREILGNNRNVGMVLGTDKLKQYADGKEVSIIGMVYDKILTKKGNLMFNIEDEFGSTKVIFVRPEKGGSKEIGDLFEAASKIVTDEVIAVRGKLVSPFIIASKLIYPDVPVHTRKLNTEDLAIALTSDTHVGSKLFLDKQFNYFIDWLNGKVDKEREAASRIKYVIFGGDLVDGIGVYPGQDKELTMPDIYEQYRAFFGYVERIPDHIRVFVMPGNHDAVQLADPQPVLSKDLIGDFKKSNVQFLTSPSTLEIDGLRILAYHGTALDSVIHNIPGCSYMKPETAMVEMLKRRHMSPIYGDKSIVPTKKDALVVEDVPDILHMGHVHKNGNAEYHGTAVVNSGTWQAKTEYQAKMGHVPTPCLLPVYYMKRGITEAIDFNTA